MPVKSDRHDARASPTCPPRQLQPTATDPSSGVIEEDGTGQPSNQERRSSGPPMGSTSQQWLTRHNQPCGPARAISGRAAVSFSIGSRRRSTRLGRRGAGTCPRDGSTRREWVNAAEVGHGVVSFREDEHGRGGNGGGRARRRRVGGLAVRAGGGSCGDFPTREQAIDIVESMAGDVACCVGYLAETSDR